MKLSASGKILGLLLFISIAFIMTVLVQSEPSRGNISITLVAKDTREPLADTKVMVYSTTEYKQLMATTDRHGRCQFIRLLPGEYALSFNAPTGYMEPREMLQIKAGSDRKYTITLEPAQPQISISSPTECFLPDKQLELRIEGVTAKPKGEMVLYQLQGMLLEQYLKHGQRLSNTLVDAAKGADPSPNPQLKEVRRNALLLHQRRGSGSFNQRLPIEALSAGVYLVAAKTPDTRSAFMFTVSRLGMVMKYARNSLAVYCVDLVDGKPLSEVDLQILDNGTTSQPHMQPIEGSSRSELVWPENVPLLSTAQSDKNGLFYMQLPSSGDARRLTASGRYKDQIAVCTPDSSMDAPTSDRSLRGNVVFDRPVYRPGQKVYYKMFARRVVGSDGTSPGSQPVTVKISDPNDTEMWSGQKTLSDWGTLSGDFDLPEWAQPGSYTVTVTMNGGSFSGSVAVSEYRKPEITVALIPQTERVIQGQQLKVKIQVRSFYGTPIAKATVDLTYSADSPNLYLFRNSPGIYLTNNDAGHKTIITDASGDAEFTIDTSMGALFPSVSMPPADYEMTLDAVVTQGNQSEYATGTVLLAQGEFDLQIDSDQRFCARNEPMSADITAQTPEGKRVLPLTGQAEIILNELTNDGQAEPKTLKTTDWSTDASGVAHINIPTDKAGDILLRVTTNDSKGRTVTSEQWMYVIPGDTPIGGTPYSQFEMVLDKQKYQTGDTARVLVRAEPNCKYAMITVEGREVTNPQLLVLQNGSGSLNVPVTADMMPGVVISAAAVSKQQLLQTSQNLTIDRNPQTLRVSVVPQQPVMLPGQMASVTLRTTDTEGQPLPAEICIGAVDEAIYSIKEDDTTAMEDALFPDVYSEVNTTSSFDTYFYSGDGKSDPNRLRQRFRDTAYWNPTVMTNAQGEATVSFRLPDNLTTWRLTARALSDDARGGQGVGRLEVTKSLITRLDAPRFLVQGDSAKLMAVVQNNSKTDIEAQLHVSITGAASLSRDAKLSIAPGDVGMLPVEVMAERSGELRMEISARAGARFDGVLTRLDVIPRAMPVVQGFNMGQGSSDNVTLKLPPGDILPDNALTLRVSASLAGALTGGLEFLKHYPYGCVEQTTSSFLPALVSRDLQLQMGMPEDPELKRIGMMGVSRLMSQSVGYTWGWWDYGPKDPWMSAYALFGLMEAYKAGWSFSSQNPTEWGDGLSQLTKEKGFDSRQTLVAYVLSRTKGGQDRALELLKMLPSLRNPVPDAAQWAMASLAYQQIGDAANAQRAYDEALKGLRRGTQNWNGSRVEELGCILWAGSELKLPVSQMRPLLDQLAISRRGEGWYSTRDTAFALIGLSRYMAAYGELSGDRSAAISVNGQEVFRKSFSQGDLFRPELVLQPKQLKLKNGALQLQVQREGAVSISGELRHLNTKMQQQDIPGLKIRRIITPVQGQPVPGGVLKKGQVYRVTIRLYATKTFRNLIVQCPVPAGMEPIDRGKIESWEWSNWWDSQITGEREVAMAVQWLDKGTREMSFVLKASTSGRFSALPVIVTDMYEPQVRASTAADWITIR